jgi:uncharacterized protein (TIGR02145 family)
MNKNNHLLFSLLSITVISIFLNLGCKKDEPAILPALSTLEVTDITGNSAKCGGSITDDGGREITARGIVWSTSENPTSVQHIGITLDGEGLGIFSSNLTGLIPNTTYFVRSYAINSSGTGYGQPQTFTAGSTPVANFTCSPTTATEGQILQFTDQSANHPITWSWDFGDGTTSAQQNPSKSYSTIGTYTVSLTASNGHGSETMTKDGYIIIKPASITDLRDGKVYQTLQIGTQIWMAENLAYLPSVHPPSDRSISSPRYYVYNHTTTNLSLAISSTYYKTYGALYNWSAAMQACPAGWHLPTDAEWKELEIYLGMTQAQADRSADGRGTNQGSKLAGNATLWYTGVLRSNSAIGTSGFSALPGGWMDMNGNFDGATHGFFGFWWSGTKNSNNNPWYRLLHRNYAGVSRNVAPSSLGASVRCIRD